MISNACSGQRCLQYMGMVMLKCLFLLSVPLTVFTTLHKCHSVPFACPLFPLVPRPPPCLPYPQLLCPCLVHSTSQIAAENHSSARNAQQRLLNQLQVQHSTLSVSAHAPAYHLHMLSTMYMLS